MNINLLEHNSFSAKYMANWFEKKKISVEFQVSTATCWCCDVLFYLMKMKPSVNFLFTVQHS